MDDMGIDLSQFYQIFFEEAQEHLENMERLLLEIDVEQADDEELNTIFRAAHSIKGGSGTFGFSDIAEFTHLLENLLDKIRQHEIKLTTEMVECFLQCGDALKVMIEGHRDGNPNQTDVSELSSWLKRLDSNSGTAPTEILSEEEAYGFFDDILETQHQSNEAVKDLKNTSKADPGYGFFEGVHILAETPPAYGFFDNAPGSPELLKDIGYGFFESAPGTPQNNQASGYGFFDETHFAQENQSSVASTAATTAMVNDKNSAAVTTNQKNNQPTQPTSGVAAKTGDSRPEKRAEKIPAHVDASIRVSVEKVDQLINLVGELVITQAMVAQQVGGLDSSKFQSLLAHFADLQRNTRDLQESVMSIRMLPIATVFNRFPRMLRDMANKLNKKVELKTVGEGTELDKSLIEQISDPMTHLVRNSLDHGIESPEKRLASGKPETGTITLSASHRGGNIVIQIADDGGGLRRDKIMAKARERGLPIADDAPDSDVWNLIFEPGFSTADQVTDISGRGVGMDVVKKNILSLNGSIELSSMPGQGTRTTIRLPLTLAIMDGMSISVENEVYVLPLNSVIESIQVSDNQIRTVTGTGRVIEVRDEYLPVMNLHDVFPTNASYQTPERPVVVIVESEGEKLALQIDELLGQQQVVVKSLESNYRKVDGLSGATIMGDGRVALILDVAALVKQQKMHCI